MGSENLYLHCKNCGKTTLIKHPKCSHCGIKLNKFSRAKGILLFSLVLFVFFAISSPEKPNDKLISLANNKKSSVKSKPFANSPKFNKHQEKISIPIEQQRFMDLILRYSNDFNNAKNEIQQSALQDRRKSSIQNQFSNRTIQNWVGKVSQLETTSEGKAILGVSLSKNITLKTWNNSLSDIGSNTMIEKGSNLYSQLWDLSVGDKVKFSGEFTSSTQDHIRETSLTIIGSMKDPEFLFYFGEISK